MKSIKKFQDWDLWLTMLKQNKVGLWIPEFYLKLKPAAQSVLATAFAYRTFRF